MLGPLQGHLASFSSELKMFHQMHTFSGTYQLCKVAACLFWVSWYLNAISVLNF